VFTERYEDARAEAQSAYTFEFVGAILLILSAGLLFLATLGADEPPRRREAPAEA
jgi:hypothetical protein